MVWAHRLFNFSISLDLKRSDTLFSHMCSQFFYLSVSSLIS
jgi:hypothetical protein